MAQDSDDTPSESEKPIISKEGHESGIYQWKNKITKVLLFQFNVGKDKEGKTYDRMASDWEEQDLEESLKELVGAVDFKAYRNCTSTMLAAIVSKEFEKDEENKRYDCFIFIFLSYGKDDKIFCYDTEIPIANILEPVKSKQSMALKPKLFFIQCGDESWIPSVKGVMTKGVPVQFETRKVPREADIFIMQSTIPECLFPSDKSSDTHECIFMTALTETIREAKQTKRKPLDIHQLSVQINAKVDAKLKSATAENENTSNPMSYNILPIPEVTSTLTKALYFPCGASK